MDFDDDLNACAEIVERGDPDRFRATMASPVAARAVLFPIYAANVEAARAPFVTQEPLIAEMRLQWWVDALAEIAAGGLVRRHEVVTPLAHVLDAEGARVLSEGVEARRRDAAREDMGEVAELEDYLRATGGSLMWAASHALGATDEIRARAVGRQAARANWLLGVPALQARGIRPLPEMTPEAVGRLAASWRDDRSGLEAVPSKAARPAELAAWRAPGILAAAARDPQAVLDGRLSGPAAGQGLRLALRAAGIGRAV
jgi:phytoene/squalene synthetase